MSRKRASPKEESKSVQSAEEQTQKSEPSSNSQSSIMPPVEIIESQSPEPVGQSSPMYATPPAVDTSGLVLVDKAWMEAMELSVKGLSDQLQRMNGNNGNNGNGQAPQEKGWMGLVKSLADPITKIIEKIPVGNDSDSGFVRMLADRYMNHLEVMDQRYFGPGITPTPLTKPVLPGTATS